jgi:hypothetical protein
MSAAAEYYGYLLSQGYGEHQLNEFANYARRANRGEISHNQAYRLACKAGFGKTGYSNMTEQEAQDACEIEGQSGFLKYPKGSDLYNKCVEDKTAKKGFGAWMKTAQDSGWIDKGLGLFGNLLNRKGTNTSGGSGGSGGGGGNNNDDNTPSKAPLIIVGSLAVVGIGLAIYFAVRKK